ncbi:hypothetical protein D3C75_1008210 [compost metagenome]
MCELDGHILTTYAIFLRISDGIVRICHSWNCILTILICHCLNFLTCLQISYRNWRIRNDFACIVVTQDAFQIRTSIYKLCFRHLFLKNRACVDKVFGICHITICRIILLGYRICQIGRKILYTERLSISKLKGISVTDNTRATV